MGKRSVCSHSQSLKKMASDGGGGGRRRRRRLCVASDGGEKKSPSQATHTTRLRKKDLGKRDLTTVTIMLWTFKDNLIAASSVQNTTKVVESYTLKTRTECLRKKGRGRRKRERERGGGLVSPDPQGPLFLSPTDRVSLPPRNTSHSSSFSI